jgi:PAS domain S-box-containing protein
MSEGERSDPSRGGDESPQSSTGTGLDFRAIVEDAPFGVLTIDRTNRVVYANPAVERILGYDREGVEGGSLDRIVPERFRQDHHESFGAYLRTGERHVNWEYVEIPGRHRDGYEVPLGISFREHAVDGKTLFTGLFRDLSARKRDKERLERQNERLSDFASILSHDVRNPLNVAMGRLDLARDTGDVAHLGDARRALERIDGLVTDLRGLATQGEFVGGRERVDLGSVARRAWTHVETGAATLTADDTRELSADPERLTTLFENLFANAVEYAGTDATVRVEATEHGFVVADDGPGVPPERRGEVFEYGHTTGDSTGLGLAIVERIVEAHGWRIGLSAGADGGARFLIRTDGGEERSPSAVDRPDGPTA